MKETRIFSQLVVVFMLGFAMQSCEPVEDPFPDSSEAIAFTNLDTTTIERNAGEELEVDVLLTIDTIIDSLHIGYVIDTIGITKNLIYSDVTNVSLTTGFDEINNKHLYNAKLKLPVNAYGIRPFRPFVKGEGDIVRFIFKMDAGSKSYEKQLKVIIEP